MRIHHRATCLGMLACSAMLGIALAALPPAPSANAAARGLWIGPDGRCESRRVFAASQPHSSVSEDVDAAIRKATGLRFRVIESIIRRSIISTRTPYGFKIRSVDDNSPALRAGLKRGDVLLEWDGQPIKSRADLREWIDEAERGVAVPIKYARLKDERRALDRKPWVEHEGTITVE